MSVHYNTLLPVLKLYVLLRVEGWATSEKPTTKKLTTNDTKSFCEDMNEIPHLILF